MELTKISKTGTMQFKLSDNRDGYIYSSGYVRVSCMEIGLYGRRGIKLYQINKKVKTTEENGNYRYSRVLIPNLLEQLQLLYAFNNKNCK